MICPICLKQELVAQSLEDTHGSFPDIFCPTTISINQDSFHNHYRQFTALNETRIIILPYRIINVGIDDQYSFYEQYSKVSILSRYNSGRKRYYFKSLSKLPFIPPTNEEDLLFRIKTMLTFS